MQTTGQFSPQRLSLAALRMWWLFDARWRIRDWYWLWVTAFQAWASGQLLAPKVQCHFPEQVWLFCGFYCLGAWEPRLLFPGSLPTSCPLFRSSVWPRAFRNLQQHLAGPHHVAGLGSCLCLFNVCPSPGGCCKQRSDPPLGATQGKAVLRHPVLMPVTHLWSGCLSTAPTIFALPSSRLPREPCTAAREHDRSATSKQTTNLKPWTGFLTGSWGVCVLHQQSQFQFVCLVQGCIAAYRTCR